jgi:cob(I)alamin adenosyltransferase
MSFKIYTKTGDTGETSLFGGRRVLKSNLRVDAYGTVDELNAFTGLLSDNIDFLQIKSILLEIQHRLFTIGAHLASDPQKQLPTPDLLSTDIDLLEQEMDRMDAVLPELRQFILPGGHSSVSHAHVCRTICRRAERIVIALSSSGETVDEQVVQYLNRLSDYFFILARYLAHELGIEEHKWNKRGK